MTGCPSPGTRDSNNSSTLETLHLKALSLLLTTAFTVCDMGTAGTMYHHSLGRASDRETQCTSHLAHSRSYPACRVVVMLYRTGPALVRDRGGREKTQVQTSYYIPTDPQYPYLSGVQITQSLRSTRPIPIHRVCLCFTCGSVPYNYN